MGAWRRQKPLPCPSHVCLGREGARSKALAVAKKFSKWAVLQALPHNLLATSRPLWSPARMATLISSLFLLSISGTLVLEVDRLATQWKINSLLKSADTSYVQINTSQKVQTYLAAFTLTSPYLSSSITNKDMHSKRLCWHLCQCTWLYPNNSFPRMITKIMFCQYLFTWFTNSCTLQNTITPWKVHVKYPTVVVYRMVRTDTGVFQEFSI